MAGLVARHSNRLTCHDSDTAILCNTSPFLFDSESVWCDACTLGTLDICQYYCDDFRSLNLCSDCSKQVEINAFDNDIAYAKITRYKVCPGFGITNITVDDTTIRESL